MRDGTNIGFVTDIEFETCEGKIVALVVGDCAALGLSKNEEVVIPWCKIVRIGDDVILVTTHSRPDYGPGCSCWQQGGE